MAEKRISNETLGKVIVQIVKDLEKNLKDHEKTQAEQQNELKQITNKAVFQLNSELNRLERFSVNLSPLDEKMKSYIGEIEKVSEKAKKEFNSPMLSIKAMAVFAFVITSVFIFCFFTSSQYRELQKQRKAKEHFIDFINADNKRIEDYKTWADK